MMPTVSKVQAIELNALLKESADALVTWQDRALAIKAHCELLEKAIHDYGGHHTTDCITNWWRVPDIRCDCGLREMEAAIRKGGKALAKRKEDE